MHIKVPLTSGLDNAMTEIKSFKLLSIAVFVLFAATSCDKPSDKISDTTTGSTTRVVALNNGLLQFVPADTPYLFASLTPLSDEVLDQIEPKIDAMLHGYTSVLSAAIKDKFKTDDDGDTADAEAVLVMLDKIGGAISSMLSIEGMRGAGIGRKSTVVLYGDGLLPVLRLRLTDSALMEQAISNIEDESGSKMSTETIDGQRYRYAGDENVKAILALVGDDLVAALVPAGHSERLLKSVLGLALPSTSMADTAALDELAASYGFQPYFMMLIDNMRIASTFLDELGANNQELLDILGYDAATLSDVCKAEIREMVGIVPRVIGGYTEVSTERWSSTFIVELRQDIAKGLEKLVAPVRGLGTMEGGLFSYGVSLDLLAARQFYLDRLDAMQADPFECEYFAELQAGVEQGRQAINQPLPPIVYTVKGFLAVVDALEGMDLARQTPPTSVDASFLLALDNPQGLLAMGSMFSPEIAALNLQADGKPVKLDLPPISAVASEAYVAMTDHSLAVSVGKNASGRLTDLLKADFADPAPFTSMNMDGGRYYNFIAEAMQLSQAAGSDNTSPELVVAMTDLMVSFGDWFGRISVDVNFTERGVEMLSTMELIEEQ